MKNDDDGKGSNAYSSYLVPAQATYKVPEPKVDTPSKIKEPYYENLFCHLLTTLMREFSCAAQRERMKGDEERAAYYQGQSDAFGSAYQHYQELR